MQDDAGKRGLLVWGILITRNTNINPLTMDKERERNSIVQFLFKKINNYLVFGNRFDGELVRGPLIARMKPGVIHSRKRVFLLQISVTAAKKIITIRWL